MAEKVAQREGVDLEVIVPAATLHDLVVYTKNSIKSHLSAKQSAVLTRKIFKTIKSYPRDKIEKVVKAIEEHSFSSGLPCSSKEAMILHYANKLESSGAISIMRGFASVGGMSTILIHPTDPFSRSWKLDDLKYALNLYIARCLKMPHSYTPKPRKN